MTIKQIESVSTNEQETPNEVEVLFEELLAHEPKPIANFVPQNAAEQKQLFLSGEIENPVHTYSKLDAIDYAGMYEGIQNATASLAEKCTDEPIKGSVYEDFGDRYLKTAHLMELASRINNEDTPDKKQELSDQYMQLNIELYGEPEEAVYRSLVNDALNELRTKNFTGKAGEIYTELLGLVPRVVMELDAERFRPSQETIEWAGRVIEALYGGLLSHVPEKDSLFNQGEIKNIIEEIIATEFVDSESGINAAENWSVVIEPAQSLNVKVAERKIVIPEGRQLSEKTLKSLVVHEIGVHMLRGIMGEQTNVGPLRTGLVNYYDSEEGLGVVAEQAYAGTYRVAGEGHYITAGLAHFDQMNFREVFEVKWRLAALSKLKDGQDLTEESIDKTQSVAYGSTMRSFRGTDTIPYFKDLAYYNGADSVWRYLEEHQGDDEYLSLLLLGKADPSIDSHRRTLLESSTN